MPPASVTCLLALLASPCIAQVPDIEPAPEQQQQAEPLPPVVEPTPQPAALVSPRIGPPIPEQEPLAARIEQATPPRQAPQQPRVQPAAASIPHVAALDAERAAIARTQTLLARAGFSPGLIDGVAGRKTRLAAEHFQRSRVLPVTGVVDEATLSELAKNDAAAAQPGWCRLVTVSRADLDLITGPIPEDWNLRAALAVSGYADLRELLAERGWCSTRLVDELNPGVDVNTLSVGATVVLPAVGDAPLPRLARLEILLGEKLVLGYDAHDRLAVLTHCSIALNPEDRPVGELRVATVIPNPDYTFDPKDWPEVTNVTKRLRIAPGPRCPVGVAWIGLDRPRYGIHGSPRPQDIGKTGSHGCFRLTNWDAARIGRAIGVDAAVSVRE
jgi:lipoprotein-anchoring transpeptidase ErfK/SrfK